MSLREKREKFQKLFKNQLTKEEGVDFLTKLYKKESKDDIQIATEIMREHMVALEVCPSLQEKLFDNCGTGGDKSGLFNVSTTVSFILSANGLYVAKHGNRSITSKSGSADLLEAFGMNLNLKPKELSKLLEETGFAFIFATNHHLAMEHIMPIRKSIPHRTIFNILGPLSNPAKVKKQCIGVFDKEFNRPMMEVLRDTGATHGGVFSGASGIDEVVLHQKTFISELKNNTITDYTIKPWEYGFKRTPLSLLQGGDAKENVKITYDILNNEDESPRRDLVVINGAVGLMIGGVARDIEDGIAMALEVIENKKALNVLKNTIEVSNKL